MRGDGNFLTADSTALHQVIVAPDYSIAANPSVLTVRRGHIGTSTLTVAAVGGYNGQVAFTCSGLPQFGGCSFTPASLTMAGDDASQTVQFTLTTAAATSAANRTPPIPGSNYKQTLVLVSPFGVFALLAVATRRKYSIPSRRWRWMQMLVLAVAVAGIASCGSSGSTIGANQVPLGTSTVTTTASASGGSVAHSATITITIIQ